MKLVILCIALCSAAVACNRGASVPAPPAATARTQSGALRSDDPCPVHVPATSVIAVNTKAGVAMYFTTTQSNVAEVRRRVAVLAKMQTEPDPMEMTGPDTEMPWAFGPPPTLVPLTAKAQEMPDGASLILTPLNPMDVERLRAYARAQAHRMQLGRCGPDFMRRSRAAGPQNAEMPPTGTLGGTAPPSNVPGAALG